MRRVVPYAVLPLALIASALAGSPWLRAFPSSVISVPLFGAAVLSVLVPLIVVGVGARRLWISASVDVVLFVFFELLVTLRSPGAFDELWTGLVHGPSQILTFALPLVSPRELLVAPVALCWLAGAVLGECVARGWQSVVPYAVLLTGFGLSYAATIRAISSSADGRRYDTLLAGSLLGVLLLLRAAQAWVAQERSAAATQLDGRLPLRGLRIGAVTALVVTLAAAGVVQSDAFTGRPTTPARTPPLNQSEPLTPVSFVSGLRPTDGSKGRALFSVTFDRSTSNYVSIASVDTYDGSGWTFDRTFRPSGGVVPAEDDPTLRPTTRPVNQTYTIDAGPMTESPWMPYLHRVVRVTGLSVNIDPDSGMVVPAGRLSAGTTYSVESSTSQKLFAELSANAMPSLSGDSTDIQLPAAVRDQVGTLIQTLQTETGVSSTQQVAFLQAVAAQFRTKDSLSGGTPSGSAPGGPGATPAPLSTPAGTPSAGRPSSGTPSSGTPPAGRPTPSTAPTASATPAPSAAPTGRSQAGGNGFADVLASIQQNRSATPEQYSTLIALIARDIGVRARLVSGFRITPPAGSTTLPQGRYVVTADEAWTWVEIPIDGVGWAVLDASPGAYSGRPQGASNTVPPPSSANPTPTSTAVISQANDNTVAQAPKGTLPQPDHISSLAIAVIVVAVILAVLLAFVVLLVLRKRLRRRRRSAAGDPRRRIVGAWQESLDVLVESGLPDLETLTSAEVSAVTEDQFGGEPAAQARYLGDVANTAIFAPTTCLGAAEADAAWQAHTVLRRSIRRRLSWRARIGATLRYHRPSRSRAVVGPTSWEAAARDRADRAEGRQRGGRHSSGARRGTRRAH